MDNVQEKLNDVQKNLDAVQDMKNKIYTDFITILGIFTSITFATFGGLQLLGKVFGKAISIKSSNKEVGNAIILSGFFILALYIILCALFGGLQKLQNRSFFILKSKAGLFIASSVLIILFGVTYQLFNIWASVGILLVIFVSILFICKILIFNKDEKGWKKLSLNIYDSNKNEDTESSNR